jgi:hypothetical protein
LHAQGTAIVDQSGRVVQLTGVSVQGMESANAEGSSTPETCNNGWKPLSAAQVEQIAGYGFNSVRLPIAWGNLEPTAPTTNADGSLTHHWNSAYVAALTQEVEMLADAHLYVILDMHQSTWSPRFSTPATAKRPGCPGQGMPAWLNPSGEARSAQQATCAFYAGQTEPGVPGTAWGDFAAAEAYIDGTFADQPAVVAQDVVNEPYCGQPTTNLTGFYDAVTPVIHQANPNLLLLLEDKADPGTYELTALPDLPNIVLSIHLHEDYWSSPAAGQSVLPVSGQAALSANDERAARWDVPLYVGEFYAFDVTGNQNGLKTADANWAADTAAFLSYCRANDISWSYWSWVHKVDWMAQPSLPPTVLGALGSPANGATQ